MWAVLDYTNTKLVERELLLVKASILGPEMLHRQLPDTYHEDHEHEISDDDDDEVCAILHSICFFFYIDEREFD